MAASPSPQLWPEPAPPRWGGLTRKVLRHGFLLRLTLAASVSGLAKSRSVPGPWDQAYSQTTTDHHQTGRAAHARYCQLERWASCPSQRRGHSRAAAPRTRLTHESLATWGMGLTLRSAWEPTAPRRARVILAGCATSVPFTTVLTGSERTTTDNATAHSTSALPRLRRRQSWPIWLWEQGVGARGYGPYGMGRRPAQSPCPAGEGSWTSPPAKRPIRR